MNFNINKQSVFDVTSKFLLRFMRNNNDVHKLKFVFLFFSWKFTKFVF